MPSPYGFAYAGCALKFLESIQTAKIREQIKKKIASLADDPVPQKCKKLEGTKTSVYRIRSGDYRILYEVRDSIIVILDIGHRKDIYR